jgi:hypothetical protein
MIRKRIKLNCKLCNQEFKVYPYRAKTAEFCSVSHRAMWFSNRQSQKTKEKIRESAIKRGFGTLIKPSVEQRKGHQKGTPSWNKGLKGYLAGEKHYKWKKDRSQVVIGDRSLNDPLQKEWRIKVKRRDGWRCRMFGVNCKGKLEAHHILPWSKFAELRFDIRNGITLCHAHHPRKNEDVAKLSPYFQELVASLD